VVGVMLSVCSISALGQYDRVNLGTPAVGATANYRFAEASELPITVTLLGAVQRPGRYEISRKIDLVNLFALAGGWLENSDMSNVRISRVKAPGPLGERIDLKLDLGDPSEVSPQFLLLQDGDNVFVGTSKGLTLPAFLSIVSTASAIAMAVAYITLAKN
jgi:hypothetical protein